MNSSFQTTSSLVNLFLKPSLPPSFTKLESIGNSKGQMFQKQLPKYNRNLCKKSLFPCNRKPVFGFRLSGKEEFCKDRSLLQLNSNLSILTLYFAFHVFAGFILTRRPNSHIAIKFSSSVCLNPIKCSLFPANRIQIQTRFIFSTIFSICVWVIS